MKTKEYEQMKEFFYSKICKNVAYKIDLKDKAMYSDYFTPQPFKEACYIQFASSYLSLTNPQDKNLYYIDSYDSFVFGIYLVNYGDKIELTDFNRTWECGVTEFEGSGLACIHYNDVKELVQKNGFSMEKTEIHKETTLKTFVKDAITLTKLMLMINYIKDKPPYLTYNKNIRKDIQSLKKSWLDKNN